MQRIDGCPSASPESSQGCQHIATGAHRLLHEQIDLPTKPCVLGADSKEDGLEGDQTPLNFSI